MTSFIRFNVLVLTWAIAAPAAAQRNAQIPDPDPEVERKTFQVADGFEVNLFAADPMLAKPIQMNFDAAGRLWVACSEAYPQIKPGEKQNDRIIVLEDTKGVGRADKTRIFADGLLIPTGLEPGDGGVYVADSTDIVHFSDTDGDGKADRRRVILSGFGTEDTHHIIHTFRWGHDGLLYFNQSIYIHSHVETPHGPRRLLGGGIWAFRPETQRLEVFARGWINTWGHHFDRYGQSFVTDGAGGEGINYVVPGASYPTAVGVSRVLNGLNPGSPKYCGAEIVSGRHLPDDWQGNIITNDFRANRVCQFTLQEDGTGFAARQMTDLIRATHPAFRPVDVKMGPDGAIYLADWYNPIIQHGEVDFRDPRRDKTHGRIWRITAKGRPLVERPKLVGAKVEELLEALNAPEGWTRQQAKRVLKERGAKEVLPALAAWVKAIDATAKGAEENLLEALWTYQSLDVVEPNLLRTLLEAKDHRVRAAAVRVAAAWLDRLGNARALLTARVTDEHPRVRMEAVRAVAGEQSPQAAEAALLAINRPTDKFLDYALWLTTKELEPVWLPAMQKGEITFGGDVQRLTFALKTAGANAGVKPLVDMLQAGKVPAEREENVLALIAALGKPNDLSTVLDIVVKDATPASRKLVLMNGLLQAARERNAQPESIAESFDKLLKQEPDIRATAARLAGAWKFTPAQARVVELAQGKDSIATVRAAAVEALVAFRTPESRKALDELAKNGPSIAARMDGAAALTELDVAAAAAHAADILANAGADADPTALVASFLRQKEGVATLARAVQGKVVQTDVAKIALRTARASGRDVTPLADALTTAGKLTNPVRALTAEQMQAMLAEVNERGNAARGEAVYRRKDMACLKCHAIGGAGGAVGPDLASIGAGAQRDYVVEALLLPNKAVKEGFHSLVVTTTKGKVHTGIKVRQDARELVLRNAEDQEVAIPVGQIDEQKPGASLMPEGLTDTLTKAELLDLSRFLSELGKVGPYQVGKERLVRRWQVLEPTPAVRQGLQRGGVLQAANDAPWQTWTSAYTTVVGELPLSDVPVVELPQSLEKTVVRFGAARCQLEVTTPGKVKLLVNKADGLQIWLDGTPVELSKEMVLDLKSGMHSLTVGVDPSKRRDGLRVELVDVAGSAAQVRAVGGK